MHGDTVVATILDDSIHDLKQEQVESARKWSGQDPTSPTTCNGHVISVKLTFSFLFCCDILISLPVFANDCIEHMLTVFLTLRFSILIRTDI